MNGFKRSAMALMRLGAVFAGLGGCAPPEPETQRVARTTPQLWVWWIHGTEGLPFERLVASFKNKYDVEIEHPTSFDSQLTRERAAQELALAGRSTRPRDTGSIDGLQANVGHDLRRWAHRQSPTTSVTNLLPLNDYLSADSFWPEVACEATVGEHLVATPLNVHRDNGLYFNTEQVSPSELDTWDDVLESGVRFAGAQPWEVALVVFENWLIARKGAAFYRKLLGGHGALECASMGRCRLEPTLRDGLSEVLSEVSERRDLFVSSYSWEQMVTRVAQGNEVGVVMGSWAPGFAASSIAACSQARACQHDVFRSEQGELPLQFIPTPGTEQAFVYTSDVLALQRGTNTTPQLLQFATFATEPDSQVTFSSLKGSIPAVRDFTSLGALMDHARGDYYEFAEEAERPQTRILGMSGLCPPEFNDPVQEAVWCLVDTSMSPSCDQLRINDQVAVETVVRVVEAHYDLLTAGIEDRKKRDACVIAGRETLHADD